MCSLNKPQSVVFVPAEIRTGYLPSISQKRYSTGQNALLFSLEIKSSAQSPVQYTGKTIAEFTKAK